jgi:hypothetical protein
MGAMVEDHGGLIAGEGVRRADVLPDSIMDFLVLTERYSVKSHRVAARAAVFEGFRSTENQLGLSALFSYLAKHPECYDTVDGRIQVRLQEEKKRREDELAQIETAKKEAELGKYNKLRRQAAEQATIATWRAKFDLASEAMAVAEGTGGARGIEEVYERHDPGAGLLRGGSGGKKKKGSKVRDPAPLRVPLPPRKKSRFSDAAAPKSSAAVSRGASDTSDGESETGATGTGWGALSYHRDAQDLLYAHGAKYRSSGPGDFLKVMRAGDLTGGEIIVADFTYVLNPRRPESYSERDMNNRSAVQAIYCYDGFGGAAFVKMVSGPQEVRPPLTDMHVDTLLLILIGGTKLGAALDYMDAVKVDEPVTPGASTSIPVHRYHINDFNGVAVEGVTKTTGAEIIETEAFPLAIMVRSEYTLLAPTGRIDAQHLRLVKGTSAEDRIAGNMVNEGYSGLESLRHALKLKVLKDTPLLAKLIRGMLGTGAGGLKPSDFTEHGVLPALVGVDDPTATRNLVTLLEAIRNALAGVLNATLAAQFNILIDVVSGRNVVSGTHRKGVYVPLPLYSKVGILNVTWYELCAVFHDIRTARPTAQESIDGSFRYGTPDKCVVAVGRAVQKLIHMSTADVQAKEILCRAVHAGGASGGGEREGKDSSTPSAKKAPKKPAQAKTPTKAPTASYQPVASPSGFTFPTGDICLKTLNHVMNETAENFCKGNKCRGAKHMTYKTEFFKTKEELSKYLDDHAKFWSPERIAKTIAGYVKG